MNCFVRFADVLCASASLCEILTRPMCGKGLPGYCLISRSISLMHCFALPFLTYPNALTHASRTSLSSDLAASAGFASEVPSLPPGDPFGADPDDLPFAAWDPPLPRSFPMDLTSPTSYAP